MGRSWSRQSSGVPNCEQSSLLLNQLITAELLGNSFKRQAKVVPKLNQPIG